jgi:hypothetical protein
MGEGEGGGGQRRPFITPIPTFPLKGEGGSGLLTLSQKESSPEDEGFLPFPSGTPEDHPLIKNKNSAFRRDKNDNI